jgi:thioesterase domain-containing protein
MPSCKCRVHHGLQVASRAIYYQVVMQVEELLSLHPGAKISVVGHSMGGALAQLIAINLAIDGYSPSIVTFGSIRVGDQ